MKGNPYPILLPLYNFWARKPPLTTTTTYQTLLNKQTNKQDFRVRKVPESVILGDKN